MPLKSTSVDKPIHGNAAKYLCYREAWTRVSLAREQGFPFEAIAILESIIRDRLLSYLDAIGSPCGNPHESLYLLLKHWQKAFPRPASHGAFADLAGAINDWREKRNRAVHGIVHPPANSSTSHIDEFLIVVETAAEEGTALAKALSNWCDRAIRPAGKTQVEFRATEAE